MASIQGVGLGVHAGLPGVARHVGHGDEEQGHAAEDEQGEGGAGAGEGPGVVVFNPDGLVAGDHALDRLAHHLHRNDDAETCGEHAQLPHCSTGCNNTRKLTPITTAALQVKNQLSRLLNELKILPLTRRVGSPGEAQI